MTSHDDKLYEIFEIIAVMQFLTEKFAVFFLECQADTIRKQTG